MTSSIPAGDNSVIPARFRIFPNYDLSNPGIEGTVVQPGTQRALVYQNSLRSFLTVKDVLSDDNIQPAFLWGHFLEQEFLWKSAAPWIDDGGWDPHTTKNEKYRRPQGAPLRRICTWKYIWKHL